MNAVLIGIVVPVVTAVITWQLVLHTLPNHIAKLMEVPVKEGDGATHHEPVTRTLVVVLIASVVVIGIGFQVLASHRADKANTLRDDKHDAAVEACTKEWAAKMTATINIGRDLNKDLQDAETRRDNAVDEIILDVVDFQANKDSDPTQEQLDGFQADLDEFVAAKNNLIAVTTNVTEARDNNPYPILTLTCETGQRAAEQVTS